MQRFTIWLIALALSGGVLHAQSMAGTWQGTLSFPDTSTLRLVIRISAGDDDKLQATTYSIDQGGQAMPVNPISRSGSNIKMTIAAINAGFEGKLSRDGNTIAGVWTQGAPLPFNLVRATAANEWAIPEPSPSPKNLPVDAKPQFEVATIKPSGSPVGRNFTISPAGWLNAHNMTLADLIKISWGLHRNQITGGPSWFEDDKYDITAKPDIAGTPAPAQWMAMAQKLISDRFRLSFHREKKEMSAYAITVANARIGIPEDSSDPHGLPYFGGGPRGLTVRNATMAEFAQFLQASVLDQPAVDQTGLGAARYSFVVKWTPDGASPADAGVDAPPDIYTAFRQQLGLKLGSTKAPVEMFVIDHVEKPSDN